MPTKETKIDQPPDSATGLYQYPHQVSDRPLSPEDMAADIVQNPGQYDKGLVQTHIIPFLAHHAIRLTGDHKEYEVHSTRSVDDIINIISAPELTDRLTRYDAHKLIDAGQGYSVANNLDRFHGLDHTDIAHKLIDAGQGYRVANNLNRFHGLDTDIAHRLIDAGQGDSVAYNLDNFTSLDIGVASKLFAEGFVLPVLQSQEAFAGSIVPILLENKDVISQDEDLSDAVIENFSSYALDGEKAYEILGACALQYSTAQKIAQLDLESIVGEERAATLRSTIKNTKPKLRGVRSDNPYADESGDMDHVTSSIPGTEFHERAVKASRRLRSPESAHDKELLKTISDQYESLRRNIENKYGEEYARRLFGALVIKPATRGRPIVVW